ncbi:hypothetical protein Gpo141_00009922 [Globisporangium polare]
MAHSVRIIAVLVLVAVFVMAGNASAVQQPAISIRRLKRHTRALASAIGSGPMAAGGSGTVVGSNSSSEIKAANAAIATQWATVKAMLETAFVGQPSLQSKLTAFSAKVDATLSGSVLSFAVAKSMIAEFFTSLQSDPEHANVADKLSPILSVIGVDSSSSGSGAGNAVGTSSNGTAANATVTTLAPTASAASSAALMDAVAPVAVALAVAVLASL